jgi:S-DNA-T family DNA segregation ATPase FtsK/SpoIIIE
LAASLGERLAAPLRARRVELIAAALLGLGLLSALSLIGPQQGSLTAFWSNLLRQGFGWGAYLIPLGSLAAGVGLWLGRGDQPRFQLDGENVSGGLIFFLSLLVVLQALFGGGGRLGRWLLNLMLAGLGGSGTAVVLAAALLLSLALILRRSVLDLLRAGLQPLGRGWERLGQALGARFARPTRWRGPVAEPAPAPPLRVHHVPTSPASREAGELLPEVDEIPPKETVAWQLPVLQDILEPGSQGKVDRAFDQERARLIEETLRAFGAPARVVEINRGPTITQFGVEPDFVAGRGGRRTKVKVSKIASLADDLALALAAPSIRIQAPVPGKHYVGIEVPNQEIALVSLRDVMESAPFGKLKSRLRLGLGQDVSGRAVAADLAIMPHLLIAGTTGSGKSVCVNAIISCLLLQNTPDDLKLVMIDPKRVELTFYNGIPHLMAPVVVELERVVGALQWVSREMDERYRRFARLGVRNLEEYNQRMVGQGQARLPYLVVVIDELADLMMLAPDETERVITRLAQLARATGIHLIIATQRPSVDVVTGLIKANFPARVAFAVASSVDSRVILDQPGAERLLGRGDMLFQAPDAAAPVRMQGAFVSEPELMRLIRYWKSQALGGEVAQPSAVEPAATIPPGAPLQQAPLWEEMGAADDDTDELFEEAVDLVRRMRRASISLLQRRLRIGYTRAARIIDQMEERGIIGPAQGGSHAREVLDYGALATAQGEHEAPA